MRYLRNVLRAAKNIRNPDEPNTSGIPRQQTVPTIHLAAVTKVDTGRNVLGLQFNDPDQTTVDTGVPWVQSYTASDPPTVGDVVRFLYAGNQPMVLGRQVAPDDTVTFP